MTVWKKANMAQRAPKIGPAIQKERKLRRLTLEQLAAQAGVSKSMLSQIERGEANPTFAVVWSLTQALQIDFGALVGSGSAAASVGQIEVTSRPHTPEIRSADGRCRLRILSTPRLAGRTEWYDVEIDPLGSLDSEPHSAGTFEHLTALTEGFEVASGANVIPLKEGETARYPADVPHRITNVSDKRARGFLVVLYK
ncbi:helix-turn-helix domain-containing protein [Mesorhizobium sp. 1B3]|uniref:helix-turn-helix domain-containing protein n=1 Tax=Mesorhizobium sp. 1B3 TaxID=3243599 RepID=UPI003D9661F7